MKPSFLATNVAVLEKKKKRKKQKTQAVIPEISFSQALINCMVHIANKFRVSLPLF